MTTHSLPPVLHRMDFDDTTVGVHHTFVFEIIGFGAALAHNAFVNDNTLEIMEIRVRLLSHTLSAGPCL